MNQTASTTLACLVLALAAACGRQEVAHPQAAAEVRNDAAQKPVEGQADNPATAGDTAEPGSLLTTQPPDGEESGAALDDLDNAEVVRSESTNLFASAGQRIVAEELQARTEQRKAERDREAVEAQAASVAQPSQPSLAAAGSAAEPAAASARVVPSGSSPAAPPTPLAPEPAAAMDEKAILSDKNGQWAASAEASSTYGDSTGKGRYSAWQATGAPNVPQYSDHANSWASRNGDAALPEWLHVGFARPVHATSIRIRQNAAPGAIAKIELVDAAGGVHVIWEGTDSTVYPKNTIGWLVRDLDATDYLVKGAHITVQSNRVWSWNEIDAVQLVGTK
jgi:hypothetical protein